MLKQDHFIKCFFWAQGYIEAVFAAFVMRVKNLEFIHYFTGKVKHLFL